VAFGGGDVQQSSGRRVVNFLANRVVQAKQLKTKKRTILNLKISSAHLQSVLHAKHFQNGK